MSRGETSREKVQLVGGNGGGVHDEEASAKALSGRGQGMQRHSGVEEKEGEEATWESWSGCGERQVLWTQLCFSKCGL